MNNLTKPMNSAWLSFCFLLGLTFLCAIGIQFLVLIFGLIATGDTSSLLNDSLGLDFKNNVFFSYSMIIASSFGTFLLPSLILQRIEPYYTYFPRKVGSQFGLLLLLATGFMIAFMPMMEFISSWNQQVSLPESLHTIEVWMRMKEDSMAELTKNMVMVDSWQLMVVNLFAVAVMPAIAEEYYFRGSLMQIFGRFFKNYHVTIWAVAIIFSAIHVQFYGFVPRVLMGAFFGYMLVWSQNIWVPIIGHFINNGTAVVMAFYYTRQGKTYEELQSYEGYSLFVYLASFLVSGVIGWYFYNKTKQNNIDGKGLG